MIGQGLYAWSIKFEQFIWGCTIGLVFLLFAAGPALQRLVVAQRLSDINLATLELIAGAALVAYGFGFLWAMVGHMLWELILAKELEQYSAFNGYLGAARSWTRTTILSGLTVGLIMVTALDPFAVVRDMEMAIKDFMTVTTAELSEQISTQVSQEITAEANRAIGEMQRQVALTGKVDPTAVKPNLEQGFGRVGESMGKFIQAQAERSVKKAELAIQARYDENLVVLRWLPPWAILATYLIGHAWLPFNVLMAAPWGALPWRRLRRLPGPGSPPDTGTHAHRVIGAYATPKPQQTPGPGLPPGSTMRPGAVEGVWREVDGEVDDDGRAA